MSTPLEAEAAFHFAAVTGTASPAFTAAEDGQSATAEVAGATYTFRRHEPRLTVSGPADLREYANGSRWFVVKGRPVAPYFGPLGTDIPVRSYDDWLQLFTPHEAAR